MSCHLVLIHWLRIVAIIIAALTVISASSCSDQRAIYVVETRVTSAGKVIRQPKLKTIAHVRREAEAAGPRATVEHPVHDFGRMDPLTVGNHVFVIRNTGDAPLKLEKGPTTCKCTLSSLRRHELQPGEQARVVVTWNSGRDPIYRHQATVFTNDRRNKAITLTVKGRVRILFQCDPPEIVLARVGPAETPTVTATVYSQTWDKMELMPIERSVPRLKCEVAPATAKRLALLKAKSGYQLSITLPDDIAPGFFTYPVRLRATDGSGDGNIASCELIITGKKLRRIGIYGPAIDLTGTVRFGRIPEGKGAHVRLLLKLRDTEKKLVLKTRRCTPAFLQVRLEPYQGNKGERIGLYYLHIDVPKDAPPFRLPPGSLGTVRLAFDHPRIHDLELRIDLVISGQEAPTLTE